MRSDAQIQHEVYEHLKWDPRVNETEQLVRAGYDLSGIARRGANMYPDMIFRDGFYHAGPHLRRRSFSGGFRRRGCVGEFSVRIKNGADCSNVLPSGLADVLGQIKRGRFDIYLEHRRLEM